MDPVPASTGPTLTIPCAYCEHVGVTLTLLTGYGSYYRCEGCGRSWYQRRDEPSGIRDEQGTASS